MMEYFMNNYVYGRLRYIIAIIVVVYLIELVLNLFGFTSFLYTILIK